MCTKHTVYFESGLFFSALVPEIYFERKLYLFLGTYFLIIIFVLLEYFSEAFKVLISSQ